MWKRSKPFRIVLCCLLLLLLFSVDPKAYAADITGSLSVSMKDDKDQYVGGGALTVYYVAQLMENSEGEYWSFVNEFENCGLDLGEIESESFASELEEYVEKEHITGKEYAIPTSGQLSIYDIPTGVYLIVQNEAAEGYYPVNAFVVTVPYKDISGEWIYYVDASPKMELYNENGVKPTNSPEPEKEQPTESTVPTGTKLPQTGQLNWPVPVLAVSGVVVLMTGLYLVFHKRKDKHAS